MSLLLLITQLGCGHCCESNIIVIVVITYVFAQRLALERAASSTLVLRFCDFFEGNGFLFALATYEVRPKNP